MRIRSLIATTFSLALLSATNTSLAAPGDPGNILSTLTINNVSGDGRVPTTPQGITMHDGYLWVVDFGTDRIYRVYPEDVFDDQGTTDTSDDVLLFNAGDSDLNIPLTDTDNPPINSDGNPIPTCGATPAGQYCGGGGLTFAENYLWNSSPITDDIIKIDPVDGDNLESENALASLAFPSPTDMTYDGNNFWIVDWQTNTINKVRPEDGALLLSLPGPSSLPSYQSNPSVTNARPFGITWDGRDLWVSDQEEQKIYRVDPGTGTVVDYFDTPGADPKGLSWNGEYLWHADQTTGTLYAIETGVIPFGITGCLEKNGVPISADIVLSQSAQADQPTSTDIDGCFQFPTFTAGTPVQIKANEQGLDEKPIITLTETTAGTTAVTLIVGDTYSEPGYSAIDTEDGDITSNVVARPNVLDTPTIIDTSTPNPTGVMVEYDVVDSFGNNADTVTRMVYVLEADIIPPVITLNGNNPTFVEQLSTYTEPGATALDTRDGDISDNIIISGTVDTNIAGTYSLAYDVTDAAGNDATTVTRDIIVQDTTLPIITLIGDNPINLEKGEAFNDPGANASDNVEGDISSRITTGGSVSTGTSGSYVITYDVSDSQGNAANTVTRTVNVSDTAAPTITLIGDALVNHELNTPYVDQGATAIDAPDQDISRSIVTTGSVNENIADTYTISYNVTDADGNPATTVMRTVIVADTGAPSITLLGDNPMTHEKNTPFSDPGATASDAIDGDLTSAIVTTGNVDIITTGTYTLTYNVSDSSGNPATTLTRTVNVSDSTPPVITLLGSASVQHELQTPYNDAGATAQDNNGADLTSNIVVGGDTVNTDATGVYTITYNVNDADGNPAITVSRIVDIADRTSPTLSLNGPNPIDHNVGTVFVDPGATASDIIDGDITSNIGVIGTVNANAIGTYTLTYSVTDAAGNPAPAITRTINVLDTGSPSITLQGDNPTLHELGTEFTDPGATANDAADGDLSSSISVTGSVNINIPNTYTLTYNVSDSHGNAANPVTREVIVADRTIPTISLNGETIVNIELGDNYVDAGATASDLIDGDISSRIVQGGSVNSNISGTYILTYNVSDNAGNQASEVTRTVIVADTIAPTITIIGDNPLEHVLGTIYTDPGATASDNIDGDISSNVSVIGAVNASVTGIYTLTYNVSDAAGNPATPLSRTVNVSDTGAPTITITGANPLNHEINTPFVDPGATAFDVTDGDLSSNIIAINNVDPFTQGTYSITYDVTDTNGNPAAQRTRTVNVRDFTPPIITLNGNATVNVEQGSNYTEAGATATDNIDGDISDTISINGSVDSLTAGTYQITYDVTDASGNPANQIVRTVNVNDTIRPTISLNGLATVNHEQGTNYSDAGASANDNNDGDITGDIIVTGAVNPNATGTYIITYNVSDAGGNAATTVSRTVIVADTIAPILTLNGSTPLEHEQGTTYSDLGATASDSFEGDITGRINSTGSVNSNTAGSYTITYNVSDAAGNSALPVSRTVNVADRTPPVITLIGNSVINHEQGTPYTDPGVSANDILDGDLTSSVATSNPVNSNLANTYTITYNVSDAASNEALEVTRTVIVADTVAPVMTLNGSSSLDHIVGQIFVDPGVTAIDSFEGNISDQVVTTGSLNVNSPGTYTLFYNVQDTAGNNANQLSRTVNVVTPSEIFVEAESGTVVGGASFSSGGLFDSGFSGSGYINLSSAQPGDYLEYNVSAFNTAYNLTIRHASNTFNSNSVEVIVNGQSAGIIDLPSTGLGQSTYNNSASLTITPRSGQNTIRLNILEDSGTKKVDSFTLTPQ